MCVHGTTTKISKIDTIETRCIYHDTKFQFEFLSGSSTKKKKTNQAQSEFGAITSGTGFVYFVS
jgi:hypothetical protein